MEGVLLPDTHAHLDAIELAGDLDVIIQRAREAAVGPILAVGTDLDSSLKAVRIAKTYQEVYAAVGVHPHEADRFEEDKERVRALLDEEKVVAVGEIGLDYYRDSVPRETQRSAFREQLGWAREQGLPVSVHNRAADREILEEIRSTGVSAILHCFSSGSETALAALELGCMISFAGNVTFPNASELRNVASQVPLGRLLVETDSPVLAPQPRRGRRNEPALVVMTAQTLARERGITYEAFTKAIRANSADLFRWGHA